MKKNSEKAQQKGVKKKKSKVLSFKYFVYDFIRITAAIPGLIWFRTKRYYESAAAKKKIKGAALVVSNHVGFYDPLYLLFGFWYRRLNIVAAKDFFDGKARGFFKAFQCIPVDREGTDLSCLKEVKNRLDDNKLVAIFPEGHVEGGEDKGFMVFKSGMILMAMRSHCPIVPVYIEKHKWYARQKMVIGEPIDVSALLGRMPSLADIEKVTALVFEKEEELKRIYQQKTAKKRKNKTDVQNKERE